VTAKLIFVVDKLVFTAGSLAASVSPHRHAEPRNRTIMQAAPEDATTARVV
jgi:hypothetical protein